MTYKQGDIIWVNFPFSDNPVRYKPRPALIISNNQSNSLDNDVIIAQITSVIREDKYSIVLTTEMVSESLPKESEIRCNKLATARNNLIISKLTSVKPAHLATIINKVISVFEIE